MIVLDACPASSRQLRSLNYVVVSCARKSFNFDSSEIAAECIKMFGISDIAETMAMRKDRFIKRFIMAALCSTAGHYIFALWFLLSSSSSSFSSSFFPRLISAVAEWTSTHDVAVVRI